jgi:hypothetical protein
VRDMIRQVLVLLFAIGQWISAFAIGSRFEEVEGTNPGDYFIPTDATFVVWGFIYLGATLYGVYQALPAQRERTVHRRVGWWLGANYLLCSIWNLTSVQSGEYGSPDFQPIFIALTVVIIVGMLIALTGAFIRIRNLDSELTRTDRLLIQVPHAIYFAWINLAVIANTVSALTAYGITGEPYGAYWSAAMIVIATVLTSLMVLYSRASIGTIAYTTVIVWALIGIFIDNNDESNLVGTLSIIAALVVTGVTVFHLFNNRPENRPVSQTPVTQR